MRKKTVETKETYGNIPEGSVFEVDRETKNLYYGVWSSMWGTYHVKVPKALCKRYKKTEWKKILDSHFKGVKLTK